MAKRFLSKAVITRGNLQGVAGLITASSSHRFGTRSSLSAAYFNSSKEGWSTAPLLQGGHLCATHAVDILMNFGGAQKLLGTTGIVGVAGLSEQGREVRSSPKGLDLQWVDQLGTTWLCQGSPSNPLLVVAEAGTV